ncbi:hypothetical protein AMAG_03910 [Allomyces macrogynus ATCC 38327]|uniref:Uncharacterized protein n=1 Tax=Allomyces macrogynus (strain ATCC 38327) TaxID=578462 RepID=A0A0L0S719_ALLM3|nr:hypothetical protein AMAG_03910 [Allomyces macrogynus ATCC 38327]|eukprot:KNE58322.1 hypothetical protein AMAG_03910 [Allomyces macrogynus ATCC 38327]
MLRMLKGDARRHGAYVRGAQPPRHGSAAAFYQAAYAQYLNAVAEELDVHPGWLDTMIDPDENFDELKLRAALRREAAYRAQLESAELGHPVARGPAAHVQSAATKFELAMRGGLGEEEMRRGGGGGGRGGR